MSRRSILLATTVCAALVSLTTVNPASAFGGRGGFGGGFGGGGFGGGNFGRAAAFNGRSYGGGNFAPPSLSRHAAPVGNIAANPYSPTRHPEQPTQAPSPIASNRTQPSLPGGNTIDGIAKHMTPAAVAAAAASVAPAINQVGQTSGAPNVVNNGSVFGQNGQQEGPPQSIPGTGSSDGGASQLNSPGGQQAQDPAVGAIPDGSIPGVSSSLGGAGSLNNTASDNTTQNDLNAAAAILDQIFGPASSLVDQSMQGGVNGLNIPSQTDAGTASEDTTTTKTTNTGGNTSTTNGNTTTTTTGGTTTVVTTTTTGNGTDSTNTTVSNTGGTTSGGGGTSGGGTGTSSSPDTVTQALVTAFNSPLSPTVGGLAAGPYGAFAGSVINYVAAYFALTGAPLKDPDPTDTGGSTNPSGGLANNSPASQTGHGGGTGNNTETNGGRSGGLAPGSSFSTKNYGDGGGDAGDNNRTSKGGVLASGSTLATKDQGDGGGADTRGGGGNSTISGTAKVVNAGGGHNQRSGSVAGTD